MKRLTLIITCLLFFSDMIISQITSSVINISETFSQNGEFYLKSIPFDNQHPSLRGKSIVYTSKHQEVYTINRYFDCGSKERYCIYLSNDGKTIVNFLAWSTNEKADELKSIVVYKNGKLYKTYTSSEIPGNTGIDKKYKLLYSNYDNIVDKEKSKLGTPDYKLVYKADIDEKEIFLNQFCIFSKNDSVYFIDSRKKVRVISMNSGEIHFLSDFDSIYHKFKNFKNNTLNKIFTLNIPRIRLKNGQKTAVALGDYIGMRTVCLNDPDFRTFSLYRIDINALIDNKGNIEIEKLEVDKKLPYDRIKEFFMTQKYDMNFLPNEIDKWYFKYFFCGYRNLSDSIADLETKEIKRLAAIERERRMSADSINGIYIPKNLEDCFIQLDKILDKDIKKEMKELKNKNDMISYHFGLGMWIRNNWGLWGGSRLLKYFQNYALDHPDDMSGVILDNYYDWLNGKTSIAAEWEKRNTEKVIERNNAKYH